ncbi:MAG: stage II sporulation protein R [Ruminococcaceae bacterium]|nr:stage II sporulation protein R [Oscillospiraceae bacterium]
MKNLLTITVCLAVILIFIGLMPVHGENEIYDSVLRLHVLANSDSEEDQALKLRVRDAILASSAEIFEGCSTKEKAIEKINSAIPALTQTAKNTISEAGYDYTVRIELSEEEYPTRNYESFCFPSGSYTSLRVLIGEAEGQNWWCVLFPPLCLSAATEKSAAEDAFISVGLTEGQYKVITETDSPTYEVRFKVLETIEGLLGK